MALFRIGSKWSMSSGKVTKGVVIIDAATTPGLGFGLEGTDHQLAGVFLVVGAFIGHPHDWHVAGQGVDGFRHDIEVFAGVEWNIDANGLAEVA